MQRVSIIIDDLNRKTVLFMKDLFKIDEIECDLNEKIVYLYLPEVERKLVAVSSYTAGTSKITQAERLVKVKYTDDKIKEHIDRYLFFSPGRKIEIQEVDDKKNFHFSYLENIKFAPNCVKNAIISGTIEDNDKHNLLVYLFYRDKALYSYVKDKLGYTDDGAYKGCIMCPLNCSGKYGKNKTFEVGIRKNYYAFDTYYLKVRSQKEGLVREIPVQDKNITNKKAFAKLLAEYGFVFNQNCDFDFNAFIANYIYKKPLKEDEKYILPKKIYGHKLTEKDKKIINEFCSKYNIEFLYGDTLPKNMINTDFIITYDDKINPVKRITIGKYVADRNILNLTDLNLYRAMLMQKKTSNGLDNILKGKNKFKGKGFLFDFEEDMFQNKDGLFYPAFVDKWTLAEILIKDKKFNKMTLNEKKVVSKFDLAEYFM